MSFIQNIQISLKIPQEENEQPNLRMGKISEWRPHQKIHGEKKKIYEKVINIICYQGIPN